MRTSLGTGVSGAFTVFCYSRKKNGKPKKKESKKEEGPQLPEAQKTSRPPPRIVDTTTYSLKSQLRFVRSWQKENASAPSAPQVQRKYRRNREKAAEAPKQQEELSEEEKAAREKALLMQGKGLTSLYQQKATKNNPAAVLVDGYNVMFKWMQHPQQKALKLKLADDLQAQREAFLAELSAYTGWNKLRMMVAFDAQGNFGAPALTRDEVGGLEVVFIGEIEADSFIIREAQSLRTAGCPYVLVATSDNDIRDACWRDQIFPVSSGQLLSEVNKSKREFEKYQKRRLRDAGSRLGSALMQAKPDVYQELERIRLPRL